MSPPARSPSSGGRRPPSPADSFERGLLRDADVLDELAAGMEPATRRRRYQVGDVPPYWDEVLLAVDPRDGLQESRSVGVLRAGESLLRGCDLRHPSRIQDDDLLGHLGDYPHVVRDEYQGHTKFLLEVPEEVEDLSLYRDVQVRGRFVRDQKVWLPGQRPGNGYPLPHPPAELVRVGLHPSLRLRDPHPLAGARGPSRTLGPSEPSRGPGPPRRAGSQL